MKPHSSPARLHFGAQTNAWKIDSGDLGSLLRVLAALRRLGFEGFETGYRNVQAHFPRAAETRARLQESGLRFFGIHVFLPAYDPSTALAPWDLLQSVADGGAALGAERLIVSGGPARDAAAVARQAGVLNRLGRTCVERGLGLAYHNHQPEVENDGFQIEELLRQTGPAGPHLLLDAGHVVRAGGDAAAFFTRHASRIDGVHFRDARAGAEVPLGSGDYDWAPLAAAIRAAPWTGWLLAEEERLSGEKPGEAAVQTAGATLRRLFP